MRPAGSLCSQQKCPDPGLLNYVGFNNPFSDTDCICPVSRIQQAWIRRRTLPVYNIPRDCSVGVDQSSVQKIYASGVTPDMYTLVDGGGYHT